MGFSKRDKLFSLLFSVITVMYGIVVFLSRMYHPLIERITGAVIISAGVLTGVLIMVLKINTFDCLKYQTISFVVTVWLHIVTKSDFIMIGGGNYQKVIYWIYYFVIDVGSILLMMFNLPNETGVRQRVAVFFANPVLYMLINSLMNAFSDYLMGIGLLEY